MITETEFKEWIKACSDLAKVKKREMVLRKKIAEQVSRGRVGTSNATLYDYEVKSSISETVSLNIKQDVLTGIWDELSPAEQQCIVNKPSLDKKRYEELPTSSILYRNYVTRKAGAPTVKVESCEE